LVHLIQNSRDVRHPAKIPHPGTLIHQRSQREIHRCQKTFVLRFMTHPNRRPRNFPSGPERDCRVGIHNANYPWERRFLTLLSLPVGLFTELASAGSFVKKTMGEVREQALYLRPQWDLVLLQTQQRAAADRTSMLNRLLNVGYTVSRTSQRTTVMLSFPPASRANSTIRSHAA
jgi:hypothetical protein